MILSDVLPPFGEDPVQTCVLIQGVSGEFMTVPIRTVYLTSDLVNGPVTVRVINSLPFPGVHLLLGNDLAGGKVLPDPVLTVNPLLNSNTDSSEEEMVGLYPSCAVTRAMVKSKKQNTINPQVD
uniref:Uncharacterized protein n=1 Tax=Triatoma infestans TaxID=30076 RepID=A0A170U8N2_TRIIF